MVQIPDGLRTPPNSPSSTSTTWESASGTSDKENLPPSSPVLPDAAGSDDAKMEDLPEWVQGETADDWDRKAKDSANANSYQAPWKITREDFDRFCEDPERRADLFDEVKKSSFSPSLPVLLRLYHTTRKNSVASEKLGMALNYSASRLGRLAEDLEGFGNLLHDPIRPRISTLVRGLADQTRHITTQAEYDRFLVAAFQLNYEAYRADIFACLQELNLEWVGESAFIKHGYCQQGTANWPTDEDWERDNQELEIRTKNALHHLRETFVKGNWTPSPQGPEIFLIKKPTVSLGLKMISETWAPDSSAPSNSKPRVYAYEPRVPPL
jgi:hypothetical protein